GAAAFTAISTDSAAPYSADWTPPAPGVYEVRIRVTDAAGNTFESAPVSVTGTGHAVVLTDPGSPLHGTVTLQATAGSSVAKAVFEASPAGAADWTTLAADTSGPWTAAFDSTTVDDGLYDLRVGAYD